MRILCTLAALLLVLGGTTLVAAQNIDRSFPARDGGSLELDLEAGGDLVVTGGASGSVEVHVTVDGRDADKVEVDFEDSNGRIRVTSERTGHRSDVDIAYRISVPARFDLKVELSGGDLSVENVDGQLDLETMGGDLNLTRVAGNLKATTMGGTIHLEDSRVDGKVHTMGGDIEFVKVTGDVDATTMGGDITFEDVRPSGKRSLEVETMGGDLRVNDAPAGADLKTMGGDITTGAVSGHARVETMGGDISIGSIAGWLEAKTMGGDITARMVGTDGDRHVELTSMGGDIELTLPSGLSAEINVEITLAGRRAQSEDYGVTSDFDLKQETTGEGRDRRLTATGSIGDGRNRIHLTTTNGHVTLRRAN